jgi:acetyl esterase
MDAQVFGSSRPNNKNRSAFDVNASNHVISHYITYCPSLPLSGSNAMTVSYGFLNRFHLASTRLMGQLPSSLQLLLCGEQPQSHNGQHLSPQLQFLRTRLQRHTLPNWSDMGTMQRIRAHFDSLAQGLAGPVIDIHQTSDFVMQITPDHCLSARLYQPFASVEALPTLLYIHGGSYVMGNLNTHDQICRLLSAHAGIQVVAIDYRLAPEHPFPAALDDCYAAFGWLLAHHAELNIDPEQLMIGGDSVGATLATVTARRLAEAEQPTPHMQLLLYPSLDPSGLWPSHQHYCNQLLISRADRDRFFKLYQGSTSLHDTRLSPLFAQTTVKQPATLLVTAGFCPLRDEGRAYASMLANQGVRICHMELATLTHGFAHFIGVSNDCYQGLVDVAEALSGLLMEQHYPYSPLRHAV